MNKLYEEKGDEWQKWKIKVKGKVYGPADTQTVNRWIKEKRIPEDAEITDADLADYHKVKESNEFGGFFKTTSVQKPKIIEN